MTFEDLVSYVLGETSEELRLRIQRRAAESSTVRETIELIRTVHRTISEDQTFEPSAPALRAARRALSGPTLAERAVRGVRRIVAALEFDSRATPAMAGLRGPATEFQLAFTSEVANVDLDMSPGRSGDGSRWVLRGQVDSEAPAAVRSATLCPIGSPEPVARATLDESGLFKMEVPSGSYELTLEMGQTSLAVGPIQVP